MNSQKEIYKPKQTTYTLSQEDKMNNQIEIHKNRSSGKTNNEGNTKAPTCKSFTEFDKIPTSTKVNVEETEPTVQVRSSFIEFFTFAPKFYFESIPLCINIASPVILSMTTIFCLKKFDKAAITAGHGFAFSLYKLFLNVFQMVNRELVVIQCGKLNGAEEYKEMRLTFLCAVVTNYIIFLVAVLGFCFSDKLVVAIGMDEDVANISHQIVISMIPSMFFESINECFKSYLTSLKYIKIFFWLNMFLCLSYPG